MQLGLTKNFGSYSLIGALILSAGIYYTSSNKLKVPVQEITGTELQSGIFRHSVKIQGTLTQITLKSGTAVLHFVSRDNQDINVLVPMNNRTLLESNLEIGQSYTITGSPVSRGTLSIKSTSQIERANPIHQIGRLEEICLRDIIRVTSNTGHALTCNGSNNEAVNYRSSIAVEPGKVYLGYWTQGVNSYRFNIVGPKNEDSRES